MGCHYPVSGWVGFRGFRVDHVHNDDGHVVSPTGGTRSLHKGRRRFCGIVCFVEDSQDLCIAEFVGQTVAA